MLRLHPIPPRLYTLFPFTTPFRSWRFADQSRNFLIAFFFMWAVAMVPPPLLMRLAPYFYALGIILLLGVEFFGETSKGATRWLDLGVVRIQPSEMQIGRAHV